MSIVPKNKHGNQAEKHLAKRLGLQQTLASGAMVGDKGDLKGKGFRVESKSTNSNSLSLKIDYLLKISGEALNYKQIPALAVQFVTDNGQPKRNGSWVMIRECDFKTMMDNESDYQELIKHET